MGCHFLLQGILLTQGWKSGLLHCRPSLALQAVSCIAGRFFYQLSHIYLNLISQCCNFFLFKMEMIIPILQSCHKASVQFSRSVMSDSLWPHGLQHARLPCPSPTPGAYSDSCPLSRWCHPTISSSVVPFSSCPQSFQHQGLFKWASSSHQVASVGVSASASVLPMNIQDWFPLWWTGWISLLSRRLSRVIKLRDSKCKNTW